MKNSINNFQNQTLISSQINKNFIPPHFGLTAVGNSHGFDACDSTSGFVLWIKGKGVIIDPPPYTSDALKSQGIPPNLVEKVILTHCHADHDAGIVHKLIESTPVEFFTTATIMRSFLRKQSLQCEVTIEQFETLFQFREVKVGHKYNINGANFNFEYSFHSIPCLSISVELDGKKLFISGDTFYNPSKLKELHEQGILNQSRYNQLANRNFDMYDLIIHEAGIPPIHTPISVLEQLPANIKQKLYLYHIAKKDLTDNKYLQRIKVGLSNTLVLIQKSMNEEDLGVLNMLENINILGSIDIFSQIPFQRIGEILDCFEEKDFSKNEIIFKENDTGKYFYIVKSGKIEMSSNLRKMTKEIGRGDYFGESSLFYYTKRMYTV